MTSIALDQLSKLDQLVEQVFQNLDELSSLRRQLDQEMRDGFLLMAKARSNHGQKTITSLQYDDREMIPNMKVDCQNGVDKVTFDLITNALTEMESKIEDDGIRKRKAEKQADIVTLGGGENDPTPQNNDVTVKPAIKDPLLMFGVLVPQTLRSSKSCFQRCLPVVSKICTIQVEIVRLKAEYKALLPQAETR